MIHYFIIVTTFLGSFIKFFIEISIKLFKAACNYMSYIDFEPLLTNIKLWRCEDSTPLMVVSGIFLFFP